MVYVANYIAVELSSECDGNSQQKTYGFREALAFRTQYLLLTCTVRNRLSRASVIEVRANALREHYGLSVMEVGPIENHLDQSQIS